MLSLKYSTNRTLIYMTYEVAYPNNNHKGKKLQCNKNNFLVFYYTLIKAAQLKVL